MEEIEIVAAKPCVPTTDAEYAQAFKRLVELHPNYTVEDWMVKLNKSKHWVEEQLRRLDISSKYITIERQEYFDLRIRDARLQLLEAGGVDNWEWYSESLYKNGDTIEEIESELRKEILGSETKADPE